MSTTTQPMRVDPDAYARSLRAACLAAFAGAVLACGSGEHGTLGQPVIVGQDAGHGADMSDADAASLEAWDGSAPTDGGLVQDGAATDGDVIALEGQPCEDDVDCDDHLYCDGIERCVPAPDGEGGVCQRALRRPCPFEHPCQEASQDCDCTNPDHDQDGYRAQACHGMDCDDNSQDCYPGANEVCDPGGRDEDCDARTFNRRLGDKNLDGDTDGDGSIDQVCRNFDEKMGVWRGGDDCNDANESIHPFASEVCDYHDNNCNGYVDEKLNDDGTSEQVHGGLMMTFLPDFDRDSFAAADAPAERECDFHQSPGYIAATEGTDCDDSKPEVRPTGPELCDGIDNDCDGEVDEKADLLDVYHFQGTRVECSDGAWIVPAPVADNCPKDTLWCSPGDPIAQGCRTDATRLGSCRACQTDCQFACGEHDCDEVVKLAAGGYQTCALTREGRVACWGRGSDGQLGDDSTALSSVPAWVIGLPAAHEIAVGFAHACAVAGPERVVWCWGRNVEGQLGILDPDISSASRAVQVLGPPGQDTLKGIVQLSAGMQHTCAVGSTGQLFCFGDGAKGRLGNNLDQAGRFSATPVVRVSFDELGLPVRANVGDAVAVAVGDQHSCALMKDGSLACWGDNSSGQLGTGQTTSQPTLSLQPVPGLREVSALSAGAAHTCAVANGRVFCWGLATRSRLGRPAAEDNATPKAVDGLERISAVTASADFSCARSELGRVACWGWNQQGQLGSLEPVESAQPLWLPVADVQMISATAGRQHLCAQGGDARVFCWGNNSYGQLGDGRQSSTLEASFEQISPAAGERR